jgi:hypothetical protein
MMSCTSHSSSSSMMNTLLVLAAAAVSCLVVAKAWQQSQSQSQSQQQQQPFHDSGAKTEKGNNQQSVNVAVRTTVTKKKVVSLAFLGNSMLYFNDCPRLVERLLLLDSCGYIVHQDSCLRGGATLSSLWNLGNGMQKKFRTAQAKKQQSDNKNGDDDEEDDYDVGAPTVKDLIQNQQAWWQKQQQQQQQESTGSNVPTKEETAFVIINDQTQHPARESTRQESLHVLKSLYAPLIYSNSTSSSPAVPVVMIFIQTPAYKLAKMRNTEDLGCLEDFTERVATGVAQYAQLMRQERRDYLGLQQQPGDDEGDSDDEDDWCRAAPVGQAYQWLHETNVALWEKLYSWDNFHPSPHGTWLQACILYCTITKRALIPEERLMPALQQVDQATWWKSWSRLMQPPDEGPLPLPTVPEALELMRVATMVCGVV